MAAAAQVVPVTLTLEEYLRTSYRPDCDFVDGHLEERKMGDTKHSLLQMELGFWFLSHRREWRIRVMSELRTQVSADRVRLPDVAVVIDDGSGTADERARTTPPLIAIEILSPDDRMNRVILRLKDYETMGVGNIWVIDPVERVGFTFAGGLLRLVEGTRIEVEGSAIYLDLTELFSCLD